MELIVVMSIIAILAGGVSIYVVGRVEHAKRVRAVNDIAQLVTAVDLYTADNGSPPTTQQGLQALLTKPSSPPVPQNWNGPYIKQRKSLDDPWRNEYEYRFPGTLDPNGYDILSYGKDGQPGGSDNNADITNVDL
jgi:general secretion pathway protein G